MPACEASSISCIRPGPVLASHIPAGALASAMRARIARTSVSTLSRGWGIENRFSRKDSISSASPFIPPATTRARVSAICSHTQASVFW